MRTILVKSDQNIYDLAVQEYGSVEAIFQILNDNPNLDGLNHIFQIGDEIFIDDDVVFEDAVKNAIANKGVVPTMGEDEIQGDFNNDFNDDFFNI